MASERFNDLQDEFIEVYKRLKLTEDSNKKMDLLNDLQRIVMESKKALNETAY